MPLLSISRSGRFPRLTVVKLLPAALAVLPLLSSGVARAQDSAAAPPAERSTVSGVFTAEQAQRGQTAYNSYCLDCHSAKAYTGDDFKLAWVSRKAFDLFDRISSTMPDDNPGILARQEYVDIVAYMFSLNGYPTGTIELPADDDGLKRVRIDSMPGSALLRAGRHDAASALLLRRRARR